MAQRKRFVFNSKQSCLRCCSSVCPGHTSNTRVLWGHGHIRWIIRSSRLSVLKIVSIFCSAANKRSPEVKQKKTPGPFETSFKETNVDFLNTPPLQRAWKQEKKKKNQPFHLAGGKTGIPTRHGKHKQPRLSSRKLSHWMINRGPREERRRSSSLSPLLPSKPPPESQYGVTHLHFPPLIVG